MASKAEQARRETNGKFRDLMDSNVHHLRVGQRGDQTSVRLIGTAAYLHGPDGLCSCCPRRTPEQAAARADSIAAARRAARGVES